jgi:hypothetical protein
MKPGMTYPNVTDAVRGHKFGTQSYREKEAEAIKARALADEATSIGGTHRQKTIAYFTLHSSIREAAELWGDRGQRRAAARAKGLIARGYEAVP